MSEPRRVRSFASNSPEYHRAFQAFLDHTDQKDKAMAWLNREVESLPSRSVGIDAGAGSGTLTRWLAPRFESVVAIEPNPSLVAELRRACPDALVIPDVITAASPSSQADFVLCSHVFYYVPRAEWGPTLTTMKSWLAPGGVLTVALQNPGTDCMRMVDHFIGGRFDLDELRRATEAEGVQYETHVETVPARIQAPSMDVACEICEFVLNSLPMPSPPAWDDLEHYVEERFKQAVGGYRWSCDQDFLKVTRVR